jgi:hypothetical protein
VPKAETLLHVSDLSVVEYEKRLRLTALSGLLALWLGYSNTRFLCQFAEAVFAGAGAPGVGKLDHRFKILDADELAEIVDFVREQFFESGPKHAQGRVARKLGHHFANLVSGERAAA